MPDTSRARAVKLSDGTSVKIEYIDKVESVSAIAREYARNGYPDRYVILSENQRDTSLTGGRVREGDYEHGIFLSCILKPPFFPHQAGLLGHLLAVGVINALEQHTQKRLGLGWVTDVYCEGVKIGGCAIEGKLTSYSAYEYMIITIAVRIDQKNFPPRLSDIVRKVFSKRDESIPTIIAETMLAKLFEAYASVRTPAKQMDVYKRKFLLVGKKIKHITPEGKHTVEVLDVDRDAGSLIVRTAHGQRLEIKSPSSVVMPKRVKI